MNIPAVLRIAAQPVSKNPGVTRAESSSRSDDTRGRANHTGRTFAAPAAGQQQAAVVQFSSHALGLAREGDRAEGSDSSVDAEEVGPRSEAPESEAVNSRENARGSGGSESSPEESSRQGEARGDSSSSGSEELTADEQRQVGEMRNRDREVRTHEQAHKAAGGGHTGNVHLDFEVGPDGRRYAVAGSVSIDASGVGDDSEATLRKMEVVRRAALAPADPSGADRQVASQASRQAQQARAQIATERYTEAQEQVGVQPAREGEARGTKEQVSSTATAPSKAAGTASPTASPLPLVA